MQEALVEQAQRGEAEAFDSLARMVGDRCLAIAVRILRDIDLAEDAVQAALITAWTDLRSLRDPSRFEPWLHRILDDRRGRLTHRSVGDVTILSGDVTSATPDEIRAMTVVATIVGGIPVYCAVPDICGLAGD